jgi:hypothetical protein
MQCNGPASSSWGEEASGTPFAVVCPKLIAPAPQVPSNRSLRARWPASDSLRRWYTGPYEGGDANDGCIAVVVHIYLDTNVSFLNFIRNRKPS